MLVVGFAVGALRANCYLLAPAPGRECVVVDAGEDAEPEVEAALRQHGLTPAAVLATHGHPDHVADAAVVANAHGIAVHLHTADRPLLRALPAGAPEPVRVEPLDDPVLDVAGLRVEVDHIPGHTPGSVVFRTRTPEGGRLALTGDTLFAGSVGRTDLPGGDPAALAASVRGTLLSLTDDTVVLPGHGPTTTIGRERASNPFLTEGLT